LLCQIPNSSQAVLELVAAKLDQAGYTAFLRANTSAE
jgi:hypothetical protein